MRWISVAVALAPLAACQRPATEPASVAAPSALSASSSAGVTPASASASVSASASASALPAPSRPGPLSAGLSTEAKAALAGVSWAPGSSRLAVAGSESLFIVDLGANPSARVIEGDDHGLAWSADGAAFTTGRGLLFETAGFSLRTSPEQIEARPQDQGGATFYPRSSFSQDSRVFVMTNAQSRMWFMDARSGKVKKRTAEFVPAPATGSTDVLWSPTGAALLARTDPGEVRLMDGQGNVRKLLTSAAIAMAWHPRSTSFAVDTPSQGVLLFAASGALTRKLKTPVDAPESPPLAFSPDGSLLLVRRQIVRMDGTVVRALPGASSIEFSPDGKSLLWVDGQAVMVGPIEGPGARLRAADPSTTEVRWLPDGKRALVIDAHGFEVWDTSTRTRAFDPVAAALPRGQPALSPDGAWLAFTGAEINLVRLRDGRIFFVRVEPEGKAATALIYGSDRAFSGSIEVAARTLRRDGAPLPREELTRLARPELLTGP